MVRSLYDECSTTRSDDTCVVVSLFSSSIRKYPMQQKGLFVLCTGLLLFFIFLIQRRSTWTDPTMHCPVCKNEDSSCPACPACPLPNPGYIQTPCPPPPACSCPTYSSSASVPSGFVNLGIMKVILQIILQPCTESSLLKSRIGGNIMLKCMILIISCPLFTRGKIVLRRGGHGVRYWLEMIKFPLLVRVVTGH